MRNAEGASIAQLGEHQSLDRKGSAGERSCVLEQDTASPLLITG